MKKLFIIVFVLLFGALIVSVITTNPEDVRTQDIDVSVSPAATSSLAVTKPKTIFADGIYQIGTDIKAGTYRTDGPRREICYWARLKSTDGSLASIITNGTVQGPGVVTISSSDKAFETNGCTWKLQIK